MIEISENYAVFEVITNDEQRLFQLNNVKLSKEEIRNYLNQCFNKEDGSVDFNKFKKLVDCIEHLNNEENYLLIMEHVESVLYGEPTHYYSYFIW